MVRYFRQPATGQELQHSQQTSELVFCIIALVVPAVAVILRFWARVIRLGVKLWWDDWLLLATLVASTGIVSTFLVERHYGFGLHIQVVKPTNIEPILKGYFAGSVIYNVQAYLYRMSTVFLYIRLFSSSRRFTITANVLAVFLSIYFILTSVVLITECSPVAKQWNPTLPGHCRNTVTYYITAQSVSLVFDLLVLVLPLPMIRSLNLRWAQKFWLLLVFSLGYVVAFLSIIRTGYIAKYAWILSSTEDPDFTWNAVPLIYMVMIEAPIAIVGLSSPPIFQLIQRVRNHGVSGLFSTEPAVYGSKTGTSAKRSNADNNRPVSSASTDPNTGLVRKDDIELQNRTSADEVALDSILQGKNIKDEEEHFKARTSQDVLGRHFTPNLRGAVSDDSIV